MTESESVLNPIQVSMIGDVSRTPYWWAKRVAAEIGDETPLWQRHRIACNLWRALQDQLMYGDAAGTSAPDGDEMGPPPAGIPTSDDL